MEKIKCITFDKEAQNKIPTNIRNRMRIDRMKAEGLIGQLGKAKNWHWGGEIVSESGENVFIQIGNKDTGNIYGVLKSNLELGYSESSVSKLEYIPFDS